MTEKRFEWCEEIKGNFVDEYVKDNITGKSLDEEDMFHLLNEQEEEIRRLNHLVKIATSIIEWNTVPQIRRAWQNYLNKVGDV